MILYELLESIRTSVRIMFCHLQYGIISSTHAITNGIYPFYTLFFDLL